MLHSKSPSYLKKEKALCDLLDQLFGNILWEKLCSELELQRVLLLHILLSHLQNKRQSSL